MKYMGLNELRESYLSFFESKSHLKLQSASLVPEDDKTLLLISAGMAPLKGYFSGTKVPPNTRIASCQKCIRTGDIDNVGKTARHGTFFEMLGNFSFGDYFKKEAINWAWEYITEVLEIPLEKLYVSVYLDDDEAYDIWLKDMKVPEDRIVRMGKEDNFWEIGVGPCGPCSEIHFDRGVEFGCGKDDCKLGCDCDRFMEFWNLVFTQFDKTEDGEYLPLKNKNIDTGMGLERIALIMQNVNTIFDIDTFVAIRNKVCDVTGYSYGTDTNKDVSVRIITDHIRSATFMTSDGVLPSNEGRGYVLRRIMRRSIMHARKLGYNDLFLDKIAPIVIENFKGAYPELESKVEYIYKVLQEEEKRFNNTIEKGLDILNSYLDDLEKENKKLLTGEMAFKLYDTYGFPLELLKEILEDKNILVDENSFNDELNKQRERARAAREENTYMGADASIFDGFTCEKTKFLGYTELASKDSKILAIFNENGEIPTANEGIITVIADKTPFYAESGGQHGDNGHIIKDSFYGKVLDVKKINGDLFAHIVEIEQGILKTNDIAEFYVDQTTRQMCSNNHTATHLLQSALRSVLGNHVEQSGSNVSSDRLRFDFTSFSPMTEEEINKVESIVNTKIFEALSVKMEEKTIDEAREMGAMALFGEKYGEIVRVVSVDGFSLEFCGGTHIKNTSQIGMFKILSETGIAAGVRRIEAVTGLKAIEYYENKMNELKEITSLLKAKPDTVIPRVNQVLQENKELKSTIEKLQSSQAKGLLTDLLETIKVKDGLSILSAVIKDGDANTLKTLGDQIREKVECVALCLIGTKDDKITVVSMVSDSGQLKGANASKIVSEVSAIVGGKGGGRPNMAQGSGSDLSKVDEACKKVFEIL
ncbi:MAG: alanine--tRNA ligase [Lachnospirales bacterium]